jgi:hypothetical protein
VFYDSKPYFYLLIELFVFTTIILHTQIAKIEIDIKEETKRELELHEFIEDVKSDPVKIQKILQLQKNSLTKK